LFGTKIKKYRRILAKKRLLLLPLTHEIYFLWDMIALTCLLAKIAQKNGSRWTRDWIARRTTINVGNVTTKCHSFLEKTAKNNK